MIATTGELAEFFGLDEVIDELRDAWDDRDEFDPEDPMDFALAWVRAKLLEHDQQVGGRGGLR